MLRIKRKKPKPADWPVSGEGAPETPQNAVGEPLADGAEVSFEVDAYPTSAVKRWFDIIVASLALGVLAPVWLLALILIRLDGPGPVLLKQKRVGLGGRLFIFYKFRSMVNGAENGISDRIPKGDLTKLLLSPRERNPSVTKIGWVLRKTTMDELPQLLNVIKGDMSLVGPRPDMPEIVAHWPPHFHERHKVKPGMTGLAQVNGRSDITHDQKIRYDLEYVRHHRVTSDLAIILKTVILVLSTKGAR
ncbi:MAG: sugar transferase [Chloroflexi bacterium]|nr:sugar transferase [Chloroflexota bacterium]